MKRGFLFGLGSFLIVCAIGGLTATLRDHDIASIVTMLICMPASVVAIRAAYRAPQNSSRWRSVGGWLIGFASLPAAILSAVGVILLFK